MPMTLVRRPRSARNNSNAVRAEVRSAYHGLWSDVIIPRLEADVINWNRKPRFWCRVSVSSRIWSIKFGYDRRTKAGKIYGMVDEGTAIYVGGSSYPITPKKPGGVLRFIHPTPIKTTPGISGIGPGLVRKQGGVDRGVIYTKKVEHPGIRPRHFSKSLRELLNQRTRPGGLRSTTDAAVKRAFRKISRAGV